MNPIKYHEDLGGKIEVISRAKIKNREDLSLAYTPGVAEPCKKIAENINKVYDYTRKGNMVAVVTDGSAVLGLRDIGPEASLPVMEGKCALFKEFADVDAFPIALKTKDVDEIVKTVELISPMFGGINLEDISAPRCFEIEERLGKSLNIPVFHDDQHGTAIVVLAGLYNALRVVRKKIEEIKIVIVGVGAAGVATAKLLKIAGAKDILLVDSTGIVCSLRKNLNNVKKIMLNQTNKNDKCGTLAESLVGADVFIGVSRPGIVTKEMISTMNKGAIVFAMANPIPEIMPEKARAGGAVVIATGRSDFPNQINNVLAFPGIFRGLLDGRISKINVEMKLAVAKAIANIVKRPTANCIIPDPFDKKIVKAVARSVLLASKILN